MSPDFCCEAFNAEAVGKEDALRLQLSLCRLRMYMDTLGAACDGCLVLCVPGVLSGAAAGD